LYNTRAFENQLHTVFTSIKVKDEYSYSENTATVSLFFSSLFFFDKDNPKKSASIRGKRDEKIKITEGVQKSKILSQAYPTRRNPSKNPLRKAKNVLGDS
jgi:hypothetical protein